MDTQTRSFPRRDIRVSDAERDQAIAELSEHFQAGRLTQEEFDDRSGRALQARTAGDLTGLFADLPRATVAAPPSAGPAQGPGGPDLVNRMPVARLVIACVIAAIIAGAAFGTGHGHGGFGILVPLVVLGSLFLRRACRR